MRIDPKIAWLAAVLLIASFLIAGCRSSEVISARSNVGTVYDTANEKLLQSGKVPALLESWKADAPVYAEPVAICGWQDGVSRWELFYATNRDVDSSASSGDRSRYGNRRAEQPLYGRAEVTLPRRRRGGDAPTEAPQKIKLLGATFGSDKEVDLSTVDLVERQSAHEFMEGVKSQVDRSRQRDVLIFVHGFNVNFDSSLVRTAQIALDMPFNGAVVAYSWPSQGGVKNYSADEPVNANSVPAFTQFLTTLRTGLESDVKIHILVHSMGNRIVLKSLADWTIDSPTPPIANLVLLAPDVGLSDFRRWAPRVVSRCERVTLYASQHDAALIASKNLHGEQRAGDAHPPVIESGIESIDCSAVDATSFLGHSYYASNVAVLSDLFALIKRGQSASQRPYLKASTSSAGKYWHWTAPSPRDLWTWHFEHLSDASEPASLEHIQ